MLKFRYVITLELNLDPHLQYSGTKCRTRYQILIPIKEKFRKKLSTIVEKYRI